MAEIRFTTTKKLDDLIKNLSQNWGVDKSDQVRSLILADLRKRIRKK